MVVGGLQGRPHSISGLFSHDEPLDGAFELGKGPQVYSFQASDSLEELCVSLFVKRNQKGNSPAGKDGLGPDCDTKLEEVALGETTGLGPPRIDEDIVVPSRS